MPRHVLLTSLILVALAGAAQGCDHTRGTPGGRTASSTVAAGQASAAAASPAPAGSSAPSARPARWARPIERPGLPNLHQVSPDLFRSAQPTAEGMAALERLGVRTVINLRAAHSDRDLLRGLSLRYQHISMKAWHAEQEDAVRFLELVTDRANLPALVHCKHGADRTGLMTTIYRVAVQGWSKADAVAEMTEGGFGYHPLWKNLVRFLQDLDIPALRRQLGLPPK